MAVVRESDSGWVIDHCSYLNAIYTDTFAQDTVINEENQELIIAAKQPETEEKKKSYGLNEDLFKVHHPFMTELQFDKFQRETEVKANEEKAPCTSIQKVYECCTQMFMCLMDRILCFCDSSVM